MAEDSDSEDASRKRKLEDADDVRSPRGSSGLGRLQSSGGNAMRDKVHKLLTDALSSGEDSNRQRIRSIAEEVEASLYDSCKGVNQQYKAKAQTLKFNLATNEELREQVVERSIPASTLVNMSTADLARQDLKKRRVTAAEESLKEIVNNEEVQKMKQAAEGLSMRKTDQGLVVALQEKEREDEARRKDEEEQAFKRKKEEEEDKKKKEKETLVTAGLDMGQDAEKSYLSTFTWKQVEEEEEDGERSNLDLDEPASMPVSSPTLDESQSELYEPQISVPTLDDAEGLEGLRMEGGEGASGGGHLVWHGTLCPASGRKDAFDLDASLVDGQGVHDMMPSDLSVKGTLPLKAVVDYLESKMRDKSKVRSVYKLSPHHEQQHDSKAHELYRHFTESLRKSQRAGVLIDSKQMLLYAVPPGNSLAASLVADDDAQACLIAVALTSRRKAVQRSVEEITADVIADHRTALGAEEKMVKLMASVIGKVKTSDCNLRASLVAGENRLDKVPRELGVRGRAGLDQVIEYLLQQQVMVVELEPEGEEDSGTYLQISDLLQEKRRAAVVLDTSTALMYLIPPVDEAGKLLDPPADSCSNMLGVLLINQQAAQGSSGGAEEAQASSEQQPSDKRGNTPPSPPDTERRSAAQAAAVIAEVAPLPATNGSATAASVPSVGAAPDFGPPIGGADVGGGREHRPTPVVVPQAGQGTGGLAADVAPSPRPYYTPNAAAADSWKQQQPMDAAANHPPQQGGSWNQNNALGPNGGRGFMQHPPVHAPPMQQQQQQPMQQQQQPMQQQQQPMQQQHQGPPPHPYQQNNASRPPPPQQPPPPHHMAMNHPQQYPAPGGPGGGLRNVEPPRGHPHYPPGPGMPGNGGMGMQGVPGPNPVPGMQHAPGGMMGHDGNMFGGQGRGYGPIGGAYNRGPPQGYHHNY